VVLTATAVVVILNVAEVIPGETVTLGSGDATLVLLLDKVTVIPPAGAAPVNVTVPVELAPPITLVGESPSVDMTGGFTAMDAFFATPSVAVTVVGVATDTGVVATGNVSVVEPPASVTDAGGFTAAVLLLIVTEMPLLGAGPDSVTVADVFLPPVMLVAASENAATDGGITVSPVVTPALLYDAVIFTGVEAATGTVVIGNVAVEAPAKTVTEVPTEATAGVSLERLTMIPPMGAGPFNLTVPVEFLPPVTLVGKNVSDCTTEGLTVSAACFVEAPPVAVMVMGLELNTASVVTLKVPLVAPAGIVMLAGTVATPVLLEVKFTVIPPV